MTTHSMTVTTGPVGDAAGRAWADCSCGWTVTRASTRAASAIAWEREEAKNDEPRREKSRRVDAPRKASRLDVGSECRECGKWLPGERILCGRCFAKGGN